MNVKRSTNNRVILTSCTCAVMVLSCIQVLSIVRSHIVSETNSKNRDLSVFSSSASEDVPLGAGAWTSRSLMMEDKFPLPKEEEGPFLLPPSKKIKPLQIHQEIDDYIVNHLPQPNADLSKIYDNSLPMPNISTTTNQDQEGEVQQQRFVVITFANAEYFQNGLIANWMCSLHSHNITNFVVIPIDAKAAELAAQKADEGMLSHDSIYWDPIYWNLQQQDEEEENTATATATSRNLRGAGSNSDTTATATATSDFSAKLRNGTQPTEIFIEFIWRRAQLVRTLLERHPDLNVVLTDADTTWAQRPWDVVPDFFNATQSQCDMYFTNDIDHGESDEPLRLVEPLSGFIMIRNRPILQVLYKKWIKAALVFHNKDQPSMRAAIQTFRRVRYLIGPNEYHDALPDASSTKTSKMIKKNELLTLCTLDRDVFPTIHYIQNGKYEERFGPFDQGSRDQIALYHPNFKQKDLKPTFFQQHNQWYLQDSTNSSCRAPLPQQQ